MPALIFQTLSLRRAYQTHGCCRILTGSIFETITYSNEHGERTRATDWVISVSDFIGTVGAGQTVLAPRRTGEKCCERYVCVWRRQILYRTLETPPRVYFDRMWWRSTWWWWWWWRLAVAAAVDELDAHAVTWISQKAGFRAPAHATSRRKPTPAIVH